MSAAALRQAADHAEEHPSQYPLGVGKALAVWLHEEAAKQTTYGHGGAVVFGPSPHALAVARAILGDPS